jgi:TatD DNase family protein
MAAGMFIDSHCHLNYKGLVEQQEAVLARARAAGVSAMLNISTRASEWDEVIGLAEREPDVWASVGVHPHEADIHPDVETSTLVERARHPRVVGIGESGLDFYYDRSDRDRQRASFRAHIAAARETGLPIIVHTREAEEDTHGILAEEMGKGAYKGVIHCFTASADFARKALDLGLYISMSGIVTFKNAKGLQGTAKDIPEDRLLIETDSPFLAPVPHRGKPCEPAFVADTARFLSQLREEPVERLSAATSANFRRLFSKAAPTA